MTDEKNLEPKTIHLGELGEVEVESVEVVGDEFVVEVAPVSQEVVLRLENTTDEPLRVPDQLPQAELNGIAFRVGSWTANIRLTSEQKIKLHRAKSRAIDCLYHRQALEKQFTKTLKAADCLMNIESDNEIDLISDKYREMRNGIKENQENEEGETLMAVEILDIMESDFSLFYPVIEGATEIQKELICQILALKIPEKTTKEIQADIQSMIDVQTKGSVSFEYASAWFVGFDTGSKKTVGVYDNYGFLIETYTMSEAEKAMPSIFNGNAYLTK